METLDEIWAGDLLGRRSEAEDLMGYLESVAARPEMREDGHAHVLAVDARYGEGKTFFLRRLARHMAASEHPVAFVDAWVDDLEDEPIVALAATLQSALEPYTTEHPQIRDKVIAFTKQAGRVGAIVAGGLAKRVAGLIITQGAVGALGAVADHGTELAKDATKEAFKGVGEGVIDDTSSALARVTTPSMEARIAKFRDGQEAIKQMKASLVAVVASLAELGIKTPITIIIDELDRCRPTYAIKLLEEVKHLFDVPGVAFVLGIHTQQLSHSVTAAYGANFQGEAYLRRFFNRRYKLALAPLDRLVAHLMNVLSIPRERLSYPRTRRTDRAIEALDPAVFIADLMLAYGLSARDAFQVVEAIQAAVALTAPHAIELSYFLPLLVQQITNSVELPSLNNVPWHYVVSRDHFGRQHEEISPSQLIAEITGALAMTQNDLMKALNEDGAPFGTQIVGTNTFNNHQPGPYTLMKNYPALLRTVKRFATSK